MTKRDLPVWLPVVLVVLIAVLLFYRLLLGEVLFWGLPSLQFYPWRHFALDQIRDGNLPTWNPYVGAGAPLLANYQSALFYPVNWLMFILPDKQAMGLIALLHVFWGAAGMWLFTRPLGTFGRGMSTLAFAFSSYLIGRFGSFPTADAGAWMPWMFWLVQRVISGRRLADVCWLALAFAMQLLAGHAQTTWYSSAAVGFYALWLILWEQRTMPSRQRISGGLFAGLGIGLGIGIAAIQLLPTAEYLTQSQRSGGLDYKEMTNFSYSPFRLITFLSPTFYGTPADGTYITKGIYFEDVVYIGLIPLIAALAAVVGWLRTRRSLQEQPPLFRSIPFWALLSFAGLLIATGRYGPFFRPLYDYVPTFSTFRDPVRWMILPVFGLSVLAGIGTNFWGRGKWIVFWSRLTAAGGGGMTLVALAARSFLNLDSDTLRALTTGVIVLGCWMVAAALLTLIQPVDGSPAARRRWRALVLIFVALDLTWALSGLNPTVPARFYDSADVAQPQGRIYWLEDYQKEVKFEQHFDPADYRTARDNWQAVRRSLLPNLNMLDGVALFNNFDPLLPAHYSDYTDLIEDAPEQSGALLRAAGVSDMVGDVCPAGWQGDAPHCSAPGAVADAWLVYQAETLPSDAGVKDELRDPAWDPAKTVILSGDSSEPILSSSGAGTVQVEMVSPTETRYHVETGSPAYLVISQTWYPGWTATVNGDDTTLYRANLTFQAVAVPAGSSDVTLTYHISHWSIAVAISLFMLLLTAVILAYAVWGPKV